MNSDIGLSQYYEEYKKNCQVKEMYEKHNFLIDNVDQYDPSVNHTNYVVSKDDNVTNENVVKVEMRRR